MSQTRSSFSGGQIGHMRAVFRLCQLKGWFPWCRSTTGVVHVVTGLAVGCRVEPGHEFPVGGAGGSEFAIAFVELEPQAGDLLVQIGDLVIEHVDVGGGAEPGFAPGLVAERFGQAFSSCRI